MEEGVAEFVQQCLHCVDSRAGNVVPRPLGEILDEDLKVMKFRRGFYCNQCIYGSVVDVLERGFKELMQRASSLFLSGKSLKSVAVEFVFALTTEMTLG